MNQIGLGLFAIWPAEWILAQTGWSASALFLLTLALLVVFAVILYSVGVIGAALQFVGVVVRTTIRTGFNTWERYLSWAWWPLFLAIQIALIWGGIVVAPTAPVISILAALLSMGTGLTACLAYMYIDLERYQVARGYKAISNPVKGQRLAVELGRSGHKVGVMLMASSAVAVIGGFCLLNLGFFEILGERWYKTPSDEISFTDFVASAFIHLLGLSEVKFVSPELLARPASGIPKILMTGFRSFFTLVVLQQIFASVRSGQLLTETIADFWSPHEPIHVRARSSLPQYGIVALGPLLTSLRSAEGLTKEQRDQIPILISTIGPASIPTLLYYLRDQSEHVRAVAITSLGRLRVIEALPRLSKLQNDTSDIVRLALAEALGEIATSVSQPDPYRKQARHSWRLFRRRVVADRSLSGPVVLDMLRKFVNDETVIRCAAAESIGYLGPKLGADAVHDLIGLLGDADETVRVKAIESLGKVGESNDLTVPVITGFLADPSPVMRIAAAHALTSLGKKSASAIDDLVILLRDRDETVREAAASAISKAGKLTPKAAESLSEDLNSSDSMIRAFAAESLGAIGESAADLANALVEAAGDRSDRVRAKAVEALGKLGQGVAEIAVPRLVRALHDPDSFVRTLAAEALGKMGAAADEAIPALVRSLSHANIHVRANAAEALSKMGPVARPAVPNLEKAAMDEDSGVRASAVQALGAIGEPTPESQKVVQTALSDPDPVVRKLAVAAFGEWAIPNEHLQTDLLTLLEDANDDVKAQTLRVLPDLAVTSSEIVDAVTRRLTEDDSDAVRVEAARALGRLENTHVAGPALLRAAQTGEASLREEAMRSLATSQPPEAVEAFITGMRDAEISVRMLASAGWRKAPSVPAEAIPALIEALHDPEFRVRANAAHAVSRLDTIPEEMIPLLVEGVEQSDGGFRLAAAEALQLVPNPEAAQALSPLLNDTNLRLALVAARRWLRDDPLELQAIKTVITGLADPNQNTREYALEVAEQNPNTASTILNMVTARLDDETLAELHPHFREALPRLEKACVIPEPVKETTTSEGAA